MAIVTNCIEYGWETSTSKVLSGSQYQSDSRVITIPETSSRVFTDVIGHFHARNTGTDVNATIFWYTIAAQIDNNPTSSTSIGGVPSNTSEQCSMTALFDFSHYFNTYFTSSQHTVRWFIQSFPIGGNDTIGHSLKMSFTYTFEDNQTKTGIKTIRLPINTVSSSGTLTTREVYLGNYTASIPALDSYLPETSKSFKDIFVEYHSNDASNGTTNFNLKTRIDNNTSGSRFTVSQSLQSAPYYYDIQNLSGSINTATTHSIRVASNLASRFTSLGGILYATYEYDYTGSTQLMHSNIYSFGKPNITSAPSVSRFSKTVYIPTTGSVQLMRSGVMLFQNGGNVTSFNISQASSSYTRQTLTAGSIQTGMVPIIYQIDGTGSSNVNPINLQAGFNEIVTYINFVGSVSVGTSVFSGGLLFLNYITNISSKPLNYTHTILKYIPVSNNSTFAPGGSGFFNLLYSGSSYLNEVDYYIDDVTNVFNYRIGRTSNVPIYSIFQNSIYYIDSDIYYSISNPTELCTIAWSNDARYEYSTVTSDMSDFVVRNPRYTQNRFFPKINLQNTHSYNCRNINVNTNSVTGLNHVQYITYRSKTFPISGSIKNYSGGGSNIPITVYDADTGLKLFETQSLLGGAISTNWYDCHTNLLLVAQSGSTFCSNILPAGSGSYTIIIPTGSTSSPGTGGEKSFTFIS